MSVRRGLVRSLFALAAAGAGVFSAHADDLRVDVELVLAVDVSWSMDRDEQRIQRDGYAAAFRSDEVIKAILYGGYSRVAVTYVEWAGDATQITVVPWTPIDSAEASRRFADALSVEAPVQLSRTSISGIIDRATGLFDENSYAGLRRIIDVSGDGPNNQGRIVTEARDDAVAAGISINGLPLMTNGRPGARGYSIANLDTYYTECVIGGGQAFVIPVRSWAEFPEAVRRKLVLELAGRTPGADIDRHNADRNDDVDGIEGPAHVVPVQLSRPSPLSAFDCQIGEKLWRRRRSLWSDP